MGQSFDDLTQDPVLYPWQILALFDDLYEAQWLGMLLEQFLLDL